MVQDLRWIASPLARNDSGDGSYNAHFLVIARSEATWQSIFQVVQDSRWIASPSARNDGGLARNDPNSCHCEEQSDVAIHISGGAGRKIDCFAFGSQ